MGSPADPQFKVQSNDSAAGVLHSSGHLPPVGVVRGGGAGIERPWRIGGAVIM